MNVDNLRKVKELILEEPRRINMLHWLQVGSKKELTASLGVDAPSCGTIGCIAGWGATLACAESDKKLKTLKGAAQHVTYAAIEAATYFGIDDLEYYELFYDESWPEDLGIRLERSDPGTADYAAVVADAIERYIACGGDWNKDAGEKGVEDGA